ncbi:Ig-like domain-containing protein [Streptomyces sp. TLI_171]|uniref:L,D-transpeptidase n=1 Tax=Streptomyces sp. TLI_171 TaxID=1938859 RepID=UPI000C1982BE|nr:Ig-like domain-containing protein [Streptomyces sp. TLI_171]
MLVIAPAAACSSGGSDQENSTHQIDIGPLIHTSATGEKADPTKAYSVTTDGSTKLGAVTVTGPDGQPVAGQLAADQQHWQTTDPLRAGTAYTVKVAAEDGNGGHGESETTFTTDAAQHVVTAELGPDSSGSGVYGVGQPLTVKLSEAVTDPAARQQIERGLTITSQPAVTGAWYWVDDENLHFRPQDYWPANTTVKLAYDLPGVRISDGVFGGEQQTLALRTGDRVEALVDAGTHELTYKRNGAVVKTIPVTTGKPGFSTRNGIKVVLGQEADVRMSGETIGIPEGSSESYDLDVKWATRVTWSGEYVHAAPWSTWAQGKENVSHGCTGMSTDEAKWFFDNTRVGDIVQVVNSQGHEMEPFGNGFGDWNINFDEYAKHSALGKPVTTTAPAAATNASPSPSPSPSASASASASTSAQAGGR